MAEAAEIGAEIPNDAPLTDDAKKQRSLALQRDRQSRYRKRLKAKKQQTASGAGGEAAAAEEEDDAAKDRKRLLATARKRKQRSKERAVKEADVVAVPEARPSASWRSFSRPSRPTGGLWRSSTSSGDLP